MTEGIDWHPGLGELPYSPIRHMFNTAAKMDDVIHLSIGQPDFPMPEHIADAMVKAIRDGHTGYALDAGLPELRRAVADFYSGYHGTSLGPDNVLITTGCGQTMFMALSAASKPEMEVVIVEPVFVFQHVIRMAGAIPRPIVTTAAEGYQLDPQQVRDAISEKTCAIMINSPGNPTGAVYPRSTVQAICDIAAERNLALISDEVYDRLILDGGEFAGVLGCADSLDNVIMTSSLSKSFSMAGLRLGWAISSERNIVDLQRYHMFISTCENTPTQWAGVAALTGDQGCVEEMVAAYRQRRDRIVPLVDAAPHLTGYTPGGAFFIMPSLPESCDSFEFAMRMLHEIGVCTIPGGTFGASCNNALRISFATSMEKIEAAFERMIPWLSRQSF
ncbi:MAG: aspartate aminotransferase [Phycisphaeraceae bacterium]|nr:aspartate aminotransferase [Phycisphaeraceae bacterium]